MGVRSMYVLALVAAAACGDSNPAKPDAGTDAPADAAPATRIEVNVYFGYNKQLPAADIDVVFSDASGGVVLATKTDAAGKATIDDMPSVTMASVLGFDATKPSHTISTKAGVEPGDTLPFFLGYGETKDPPPPFTATLNVSFPANPPGGTTDYSFDAMCEGVGTASTSFTHTMLNDCRRPNTNTIDAVVVARNGSTPVGFAVMPGITLVSSGATTVDFPGGWRTDWRDVQIDYTNAPASMTSANTSVSLPVHGHGYYPYNSESSTVTAGGTLSRSYRFVNGLATNIGFGIETYYGPSQPRPSGYYAKGTALAASITLDLSAKLLPPVTGVALADETTLRPRVIWTQAGTHEMAGTGYSYVYWSGGAWTIQFPPDQAETSVTFPALPDALDAFRPPTDGSFGSMGKGVIFRSASYLPTYDAFRQQSDVFTGEDYEEVDTRFPGY